uniref:Uncharacterized protein n=1 Tax=Triticum urartu TaxID=4572 RepID=A0A8R7U2Y2_TRIUA
CARACTSSLLPSCIFLFFPFSRKNIIYTHFLIFFSLASDRQSTQQLQLRGACSCPGLPLHPPPRPCPAADRPCNHLVHPCRSNFLDPPIPTSHILPSDLN